LKAELYYNNHVNFRYMFWFYEMRANMIVGLEMQFENRVIISIQIKN